MHASLRLTVALLACAAVGLASSGPIAPAVQENKLGRGASEPKFNWSKAVEQSFFFLTFQHAFRLTQEKTVDQLGGPFFKDYWRSAKNLGGWEDGDSMFTNYVAHPMQGAVSGYIQIQNDPRGAALVFGASDKQYWKSRLRATAFAALYSTQFELGSTARPRSGTSVCVPARWGTSIW
ncbi:MAG: hypothetical protein R2724_22055 [Bryobacterales bacterium]